MNGVLTVKPVYLWPVTLTSSLLAYVIILDISTPPPLVILSFAFIPAGSGGPKRGQTLAYIYYTINNLTCNTMYAVYLLFIEVRKCIYCTFLSVNVKYRYYFCFGPKGDTDDGNRKEYQNLLF